MSSLQQVFIYICYLRTFLLDHDGYLFKLQTDNMWEQSLSILTPLRNPAGLYFFVISQNEICVVTSPITTLHRHKIISYSFFRLSVFTLINCLDYSVYNFVYLNGYFVIIDLFLNWYFRGSILIHRHDLRASAGWSFRQTWKSWGNLLSCCSFIRQSTPHMCCCSFAAPISTSSPSPFLDPHSW